MSTTNESKAARSRLERYRENLQEEVDSAALYRAMAGAEPDPNLSRVYLKLAEVEERHAALWEAQIEQAGGQVGPRRPSLRSRIMIGLAARFGAQLLLPTVANLEQVNRHVYDAQPEATSMMRGQERSHARVLRAMEGKGGVGGAALARIEGRHRYLGGNTLRAAVLGANDGLVSNLSLVMGVAGAALSEHAILVTGLAGLLAGGCSMAMGEWISIQSSREAQERQVRVEEAEIAALPDEEEEELALIYMAKGVPEDEAKQIAARIMSDEATALEAMTREELGLDPDELGGSPWSAAGASFALFALGAVVPVLPFALLEGAVATWVSIAASALALAGLGAAITLFTGRGVAYTAGRQLLFGLGAAAITFGIGRGIGVSLAP